MGMFLTLLCVFLAQWALSSISREPKTTEVAPSLVSAPHTLLTETVLAAASSLAQHPSARARARDAMWNLVRR